MKTLTLKGITFTLNNTEARELLVLVYGERQYNWPEEAKKFLTIEDRLYIRGYRKGISDGPTWQDESSAVWEPELPSDPHYVRGYEEGHWEASQDI